MGKWSRRAFITSGIAAGGVVVFGVAIRRGNRTDKVRSLIAGANDALFDIWLKISPDNSVTVIVPHAEMGQGVHTTLAMMLADELDADWSKVSILEAPSHKEFANYALAKGYAAGNVDFPAWLIDTVDGFFFRATQVMGLQITGGSTSVKTTGQFAMRVTGAAARAVLLEAAAEKWQVPVNQLSTRDSMISHHASNLTATFASFAVAAARIRLPAKPVLKRSDQLRIMGTSPPRTDIPAKVDGSAMFGIDASLPGMKYAAIRAAPVFGGAVASYDAASVQDMPGVRKVINLDDAVAVVADGYWQARQALDRLHVEFDDAGNSRWEQSGIYRQFADDLDKSAAAGSEEIDVEAGDAATGLRDASTVVTAEYRVPYLAHSPMEPMNCTAWVHDDQCELWLGTQNPLGFARDVSNALDIDLEKVTVHNQYLGGGFGRRAFSDIAVQAARVAADVHYPVKLVWSREEDTRHDHYRQASISRFRGGLDASGNAVAWHNHYVNKHDPEEAPHIPYAIDNQRIVYTESSTHVPWGFWRSVDHSLHAFFTESFIDEMAVAAGRDPYEYRRELLADQPRFLAVLDLAASKAGWGQPLAKNSGRGISIHRSFGTIVAEVVDVEVIAGELSVKRVVCAVDAGFAVHPDGMAAQMESGIAYGMTAALYGEISIRHGAVAQSNFHDYPMLRMDKAPLVETHIINSGEALGGAGEPGTPPIAPALTNAIYDATGLRIRELPVRLHDLGQTDHRESDIA
ncbi:MAG: molybdopterin-dependent oxidoreductase [Gammaproteobacteria bacterium]|nr:molybdopterin-dependent oxidoreductase [Gammaproteobacteria bacterium]MDH3432575.1 molybdopterin-dependent oxidoreductase [Gammaproteobacteria bacterium]